MKKSTVIPVLLLAALFALSAAAAPVSDPASSEHNNRLVEAGHALELAGRRDEALADYTEAIESHTLDGGEQARAFFARGLLLDGMSRLDDALRDYSAALRLSPKFAAAWNNRANVYRRLDRFAEAEHDYRASLAVGNPQNQYSYYGLGEIAEAQGKTDQAREFYAQALATAPDFALASNKLAALDTAQPIHLHPPLKVAQQGTATPIILHPPKSTPVSKPIHLRPPVPVLASYEKESPALKPALDQGSSGTQIQLGAWRTEAEAAQGWNRAVKQAEGVLGGYSPHIVAVDLPGAGRYYRLRVTTDNKEGSRTLCAALAAKELACIPARD